MNDDRIRRCTIYVRAIIIAVIRSRVSLNVSASCTRQPKRGVRIGSNEIQRSEVPLNFDPVFSQFVPGKTFAHALTSPFRIADLINSAELWTPSFSIMFARCVSTVLMLMFNRSAISRLFKPSATSCST